jgi:N-acetylmuramoyl-L-alanine amidase
MKKIILLLIGLIFLSLSSSNAQSLAGYKFCINPGHGGNDSNDRQIPLGNGINFWESEGNLTKGLYLRDMLEALGATVIMTRTQNRTEDDLPLSQIVAIANTNNVDFFHSIHSNATGTSARANYTLILFNGTDTAPTNPAAKEMGAILAQKIFAVNRTTSTQNRGDRTFLGFNLGVLNGLNMPGTLSEGSFHDYLPEAWRLKNNSYLKHEAWAIARSFLQYCNAGTFINGIVAGIVRDLNETVPSSYLPIGNDVKKPLNKIKVRLEPGDKVYNGDEFNNGFYMFDEVTPGNYQLIFEVDKMRPDTVSVTSVANLSVFKDRLLTLNPILDPPQILSYSPADSVNEVSNVSPVVIEFDIRMNAEETQKAFSITPEVAGSYKWDTDFKKITFTPSKGYLPGTKYTILISTAAKTHFGFYLQQQKSFSFTTRSKLNLVFTYPKSGESNISTSVLMRLKFDKGIDGSSMANKITVADSTGIPILLQANISRYGEGIIDFEPKTQLNNNTTYTITVKEGISDAEYVKFTETVTIEYKTESRYTFDGNLIEGFESGNLWQSPLLSPNTIGVNTSTTNFTIATIRKRSGNSSGRLNYTFTGNSGEVELAIINPINLGQSSSAGFGIWVYGDNSFNILEYRFLRSGSTIEKVFIDTLNWTGWKLKKIWLNEIPGSGQIEFKSINIVQTANGETSGTLFFDECISNIVTDVFADNSLPGEFILEQNFPNPFNPTTTIRFSLPDNRNGQSNLLQNVSLKIYDMLGREVSTLIDEEKAPGNYEVKFNAKNLASGVYIYRLQSGDSHSGEVFIQSKKLILLK